MHFDRRHFLKASCTAAAISLLAPSRGWAAARLPRYVQVLGGDLPGTEAEAAVLRFVERYGGRVRFVGAGVLARVRAGGTQTAHLLVEITDPASLTRALSEGLPFAGVYAETNALTFTHRGVEFTIENLFPDAFGLRLRQLTARKRVAFAYDALTYDPLTRQLSDPFGAVKTESPSVINTTLAGGAALAAAMRGAVETKRLSLNDGSHFQGWRKRHLRAIARPKMAHAIVEGLLAQIATVADALPPSATIELLGSRLVSTALREVFGLETTTVIAQFQSLRPTLGAETSNAALWLSLLLGPEIESESVDGAATTWLQRGTRFQVLRSRAALARARELLAA